MSVKINEQTDLRDGTNVASGTVLYYSIINTYRKNNGIKNVAITAIDITNDKITLSGDLVDQFGVGAEFLVKDSTGKDGVKTVVSATLVSGNTEIAVSEDITDATVDGTVDYTELKYILEVAILGFYSESFANKCSCNASMSLKLDKDAAKSIQSSYTFTLTDSEYKTGQFNDLVDNKVKAQLEVDGFTASNVVVM